MQGDSYEPRGWERLLDYVPHLMLAGIAIWLFTSWQTSEAHRATKVYTLEHCFIGSETKRESCVKFGQPLSTEDCGEAIAGMKRMPGYVSAKCTNQAP